MCSASLSLHVVSLLHLFGSFLVVLCLFVVIFCFTWGQLWLFCVFVSLRFDFFFVVFLQLCCARAYFVCVWGCFFVCTVNVFVFFWLLCLFLVHFDLLVVVWGPFMIVLHLFLVSLIFAVPINLVIPIWALTCRPHQLCHTVHENLHSLILLYNLTNDLTNIISLNWIKSLCLPQAKISHE